MPGLFGDATAPYTGQGQSQDNSSLWGRFLSRFQGGGGGGISPFAQAYNPWGSTGAAQSAFAGGAGPQPPQMTPPPGGIGQTLGMPPGAPMGGMPGGGQGGQGGGPNMQGIAALQQAMAAQGGPLQIAQASGLTPQVSPGFAPPPAGGQTLGMPGGGGQQYGMPPTAGMAGGQGPNMQGANALMAQMAAQGGPLGVAQASGLNPIVSPGFAPPPGGGQTYGMPGGRRF